MFEVLSADGNSGGVMFFSRYICRKRVSVRRQGDVLVGGLGKIESS